MGRIGDGVDGGSGVELPGAGLDVVRRDVDQGNLDDKYEGSESAKRRTEEPSGLALAPVEPQVRYSVEDVIGF